MDEFFTFTEWVVSMGLKCKYNSDTCEYEITTPKIRYRGLHGGYVISGGDLVASVPSELAWHNSTEAKRITQMGLDLHNCFA